jgi:hypothetical protein
MGQRRRSGVFTVAETISMFLVTEIGRVPIIACDQQVSKEEKWTDKICFVPAKRLLSKANRFLMVRGRFR